MHLYDLFKDFVGSSPSVTNRKADEAREQEKYIIVYISKL